MTSITSSENVTVKGNTIGTSYVILRRTEGQGSVWEAQPTVIAASADAAVKQWAEKNGAKNGAELVAIPARSFQPRKVRVETSTRVTLG